MFDEPPSGNGKRSAASAEEGIELAGIIGREHAGEPVIGAVVDGQARLHAGEPMAAAGETRRSRGAADPVRAYPRRHRRPCRRRAPAAARR